MCVMAEIRSWDASRRALGFGFFDFTSFIGSTPWQGITGGEGKALIIGIRIRVQTRTPFLTICLITSRWSLVRTQPGFSSLRRQAKTSFISAMGESFSESNAICINAAAGVSSSGFGQKTEINSKRRKRCAQAVPVQQHRPVALPRRSAPCRACFVGRRERRVGVQGPSTHRSEHGGRWCHRDEDRRHDQQKKPGLLDPAKRERRCRDLPPLASLSGGHLLDFGDIG